jgi:hypothetical protein
LAATAQGDLARRTGPLNGKGQKKGARIQDEIYKNLESMEHGGAH